MATEAQRVAVDWTKRAIEDRVNELTDAWRVAETVEERERLHAQVTATIELEDYLSARIASYAAE